MVIAYVHPAFTTFIQFPLGSPSREERQVLMGQTGRPRLLSSLSIVQDTSKGELSLARGPLGQRLADLISQYGMKAVKTAERRSALVARFQQLQPKTQI